jgi:hypothetical protein
MPKHTPGPYSVEYCTSEAGLDICLDYKIEGREYPILIATCFADEEKDDPVSKSRAAANARLFASSDRLYDLVSRLANARSARELWDLSCEAEGLIAKVGNTDGPQAGGPIDAKS